jgi:hypothetical protein
MGSCLSLDALATRLTGLQINETLLQPALVPVNQCRRGGQGCWLPVPPEFGDAGRLSSGEPRAVINVPNNTGKLATHPSASA